MSASVTSIAPPRGTLDPLRVALAAAQQAEKDAKRAVGERETAIVRARELVAAAEAALEKTRAGVQAARAEHARRIADGLARGAAPSIAGATRMARAAEADAEDVLEAARDAAAQLDAGAADLREEFARARSDVGVAVNALLAVAAQSALDEVRSARVRYVCSLAMLQAILGGEDERSTPRFANPVEFLRRSEQRAAPLVTIRDEAGSFVKGGQSWIVKEEDHLVAERVAAAWRRARMALLRIPRCRCRRRRRSMAGERPR